MQRIEVLIDKLKDQCNAKASPSQMLLTLQLLQAELQQQQMQGRGATNGSKVAVVLPSAVRLASAEADAYAVNGNSAEKLHSGRSSRPASEEKQPELFEGYSVVPPREEKKSQPVLTERQEEEEEKTEDSSTETADSETVPVSPYDPLTEIPTLSHQQTVREINELVAEKKESYNDRLSEQRSELADRLKESPIKDLRKAIGLNDRFTFIAELFRGDEAMYERSIKTINSYHIFPEAEYWIHRELMVKLGWKETSPTVKHFYQLVKRRFS